MLSAVKDGAWGENYADAERRISRMINAYKARSDAYAPTLIVGETAWTEQAIREYMTRVESDKSEEFEDATEFGYL